MHAPTAPTQLAKTDDPGQALLPCGVRSVTLDNALNKAAQGLGLAEKRLMMIAVSKLDPKTPAESPTAAPLVTKVSAAEYADHAKVDLDAAYLALKSAAEGLHNRKITMQENLPGGGKRKRYIRVSMSWVGRATYHSGEGWIELAWWHEVMPYLTGLQTKFTTYQLQQAASLRSLYSWRVLELFMQHQDTGWLQIRIEDFCSAMQATEKQEANFNNIRRQMIEPAVNELTEKDGWLIEWIPIKAGRRVVSLRFDFKRDKPVKAIKPKRKAAPPARASGPRKDPVPAHEQARLTLDAPAYSPAWEPAAPALLDPSKPRRSPPEVHLNAMKASLRCGKTKPEVLETST